MRMGRVADAVRDDTALDGARIDPAARIGWLLRVSRAHAGLTIQAMRDRLADLGVDTSVASLSRAETGSQRMGSVIDAYECALGLLDGQLRSTVDTLARTFSYSPPDRSPGGPADLRHFSSAVDAVHTRDVTGAAWLRFARAHDGIGRKFGLDTTVMTPLIDRLASELARAVGPAFPPRYEALARLRCGDYHQVTREVICRRLIEPGAPPLTDVASAVSERPSHDLLVWCGELLSHESLPVAKGAAVAIENMRSVGGLSDTSWSALAPRFVQAYDGSPDTARRTFLSVLFRNLTPGLRREISAALTTPLAPARLPESWVASEVNPHYARAVSYAAVATEAMGQPVQPMLERLVFEMLYDFRATRSFTSALLVAASPFVKPMQELLFELAHRDEDPITAAGAASSFLRIQDGWFSADLSPWLNSPQDTLLAQAFRLAGAAGIHLPDDAIVKALGGPSDVAHDAISSMGMSADPRLHLLPLDGVAAPEFRALADWWLRNGSRIIV